MQKQSHSKDGQLQTAFKACDWSRVVLICKQTLKKNRNHLLAQRYYGFALKKQGAIDLAKSAFAQAIINFPADAEILANYATLLLEQALHSEALPVLDQLCELRPLDSSSWCKVAQACYPIGLHEKGFGSSIVAYNFAKNDLEKAAALTQRAIHRRELGQIREAVDDCTEAIALTPRDAANHTNRLLFMLGDPATSPEQLTTAAKEYAAVFEPAFKPHWPSYAERAGDPWRKLRIGFISPDFRVHAVMCFAEGILAQLDRRQFDVYAFHLYPKDDQVTARVKCHVDHFIRLTGMSFEEQALCIQSHAIDILIDMTGHTGNNALLTMVRKPAPVQVTWCGFVATTGLKAIDYYLTDSVINPIGVERLFSERLFRLPSAASTYRPLSRNPLWRYQPLYSVRRTPAVRNGFITFGSCNNLGKLTEDVLKLWARLLIQMPTARLLIEGKGFDKAEFTESYTRRCANLGIDVRRLDLLALDTTKQYLAYHEIDIALDPFPLNGGTTTCDTLWMGVPLVAMEGNSSPSRMSTVALTFLGRKEWLAHSENEYLSIAVDLASDFQRLDNLRMSLRQEFENCPLMRDDIVCPQFSEGLRTMWLRWQAQMEYPDDEAMQSKAIHKWGQSRPSVLDGPPSPKVGLLSGKRVDLSMAHELLQMKVEAALRAHCSESVDSSGKMAPQWVAVTELAEMVLSSVPHDAVALACLAEVEHAHGHSDFAVTYLQHAVKNMSH